MSSMAPTLPPELERSIIVDYVGDDETLRSCSLVCGRLCHWAQSRLFHTIFVGLPERPWQKRVDRLVLILHTSPHLASYVRSIHVQRCNPAILAALASRNWDGLEALHLFEIPRGDEGSALESLHRLVSSPVLCILTLSFTHMTWSASYFRSIFAYCSSTLTDLRLMRCHEDPDPFQCPTSNPGPERSPFPQINSLNLTHAMAAVPVLATLDLTHLRILDYHDSPHDTLSPLIHCFGRSVHSLKLNANDTTLKDFNFSLPSLSQLQCQFTSNTVWNVIERIPDHNRLTELTLTTSHDQWQLNDGAQASAGKHTMHQFGAPLERMVLRKLPCLRTVVMEVTVRPRRIGTQFSRFNREAVVQAIERSMPRLTKMRMVSVNFLRKEWYKGTPLTCRRLFVDEGNFINF
ncbi:hypothetical protein C8R45DRAFT_1219309 [Mycena sanguinolenta]|nr:hypothetical protein C8R45DRAFT_1219309 [Mycena sanguinolenta]